MKKAPIPNNDAERVKILESLDILNTRREEDLDEITKKVAEVLKVPISTISLIDNDREFYKSKFGENKTEGPRDISFCGHALLSPDIFVVEDTEKDERFKDNPYVKMIPPIRFYAGIRLRHEESGAPIGVLCAKAFEPKKISMEEINTLINLGKEAERKLNKIGKQ